MFRKLPKGMSVSMLCRICLSKSNHCSNIFSGDFSDEDPIYEIINYVYDVKISIEDGLPKHACQDCLRIVKEFEKHKRKAQRAAEELMLLKERNGVLDGDCINNTEYHEIRRPQKATFEKQEEEENFPDDDWTLRLESDSGDDSGEKMMELIKDDDVIREGEMNKSEVELTLVQKCNEEAWYEDNYNLVDLGNKLYQLKDHTYSKFIPEVLDEEREDFSKDKRSKHDENGDKSSSFKNERRFIQDLDIRSDEGVSESHSCHNSSIEKHPPSNQNSGKNLYECLSCKKYFMTRSKLVSHLRVHTGEKPYKCDICEYRCSHKSALKTHVSFHSVEKPYRCDICGKCYYLKAHLKLHSLCHTGERPFRCDSCGKCFAQKKLLKVHSLTHSVDKPHKCDVCGKGFAQKFSLTSHMYIHSENKPYKCDICENSFTRRTSLISHSLIVHSGFKPFKCDTCGKYFARKQDIRVHIRIHTGEKPFKCDICDYSCTIGSALKNHKRMHLGEKLYNCDFCEYRCIRRSTLKNHLRSHSGEKPYQCDSCGKCFSLNENMKRHFLLYCKEKPL